MKKLFLTATTFATVFGVPALAFAEGPEPTKSPYIAIGLGIGLGMAALGSALGQGKASAAALEGISRNPAASGKIQIPFILGLAFMEAITIFTWIVAQGLAGKV